MEKSGSFVYKTSSESDSSEKKDETNVPIPRPKGSVGPRKGVEGRVIRATKGIVVVCIN